MKKIFKTLSLALVMGVVGCTSFDVEVLKNKVVEDTKDYDINIVESFIDAKSKKIFNMVNPVNEKMSDVVDSIMNNTKEEAAILFSGYTNNKKKNSRPNFKFTFFSRDTIYMVTKNIVSSQIIANVYSGGAHGNNLYFSFNFSPKNGKFLNIEDIVDVTKKSEIDALLEKHFINTDNCFNKKPSLDLVTNINVTPKTLKFTFENYVLGPYACGAAIIDVPLSELKGIYKL